MGDLEKIRALATQDITLVNARDENGLTPLFWTVYADQPKAAIVLCDLKADINATDSSKETALHIAVAAGTLDMVKALISKGANISLKDDSGATPLSMARRMGKADMVDMMLGKKPIIMPVVSVPAPIIESPVLGNISVEVTKISLASPTRKPGSPGSKAVAFAKTRVQGVPVNLISIDLNDSRVSISAAIAQNGIETDESFASFLKRCTPTAAINGTCFSKTNLRPIGDIVANGKLLYWGGMGTGLCVTSDCRAEIITVERHRRADWSAYKTVICCGPRLLTDGNVTVDPSSEGFRDPHVLGKANRTGVGVTPANKLLLANTSKAITLNDWANVMKKLGCVDAVNFDGGGSSAMYYRGKTITDPGRKLTNVLLVYER